MVDRSSSLVSTEWLAQHLDAPDVRVVDALAAKDGYIYLANVNMVEEMTNMVQATRNYQANVEVMNTSKDLLMRTLALGN